MNWLEFASTKEIDLAKVKAEAFEKVLAAPEEFSFYHNGQFYEFASMDEEQRNKVINGMKEATLPGYIIIDSSSKKNIETKNANFVFKEPASSAVIINSVLTGDIIFAGGEVIIESSTVTSSKFDSYTTFIYESRIQGSTIQHCYIYQAETANCTLYNVRMESGSGVNCYSYVGHGVWLQKNALVAPNCNLVPRSLEHHKPLLYYAKNDEAEDIIVIGEYTWIGAGVNVIRGCTIGDWSILSAGATISADVNNFSLVTNAKTKSLVDRVVELTQDNALIDKVICALYTTPKWYIEWLHKRFIDHLNTLPEYKDYFKLFYLYFHSENIAEKKVCELGGETFVIQGDKKLFEFFSPDKIRFDFKNKTMTVSYDKWYSEITSHRANFLQTLSDSKLVTPESEQTFIVQLNDEIINKIEEIDSIFNIITYKMIADLTGVEEHGVTFPKITE